MLGEMAKYLRCVKRGASFAENVATNARGRAGAVIGVEAGLMLARVAAEWCVRESCAEGVGLTPDAFVMPEFAATLLALLLVSALYGSVGHGGASGYLAVMALLAFPPGALRPTALVLNVAVSALATVAFFRAGHFRFALLWPFAVMSIPCAWLGGRLELSPATFNVLLGATLAFVAVRLLMPARSGADGEIRRAPLRASLPLGGVLGLASGLVGVGGGIFLTPLLILARWADAKKAAAVSAPFIFVNSLAGLAGQGEVVARLPSGWPWYVVAVLGGGALGAWWGSERASVARLRPALAVVLAVASLKLVLA